MRLRFKEVIEVQRIQQKEIAEVTGLTKRAISEIVNNKAKYVSLDSIEKIAEVLGLTEPNEIFEMKKRPDSAE